MAYERVQIVEGITAIFPLTGQVGQVVDVERKCRPHASPDPCAFKYHLPLTSKLS